MKFFINEFISILLTFFIYFLGGFDIALKSLLIVIIIDYITGLISAFYRKKLNSKVGFKGIIKKFCYICVVGLSVALDNLCNTSGVIRTIVIYFFVANDGLSILENLGKIGIKFPKKLIQSLEQLKNESED